MGRLTFGINMTLDGCIDHREGVPSDAVFRWWTARLDATGGMLWGRTLNAKPKHVVSSSRRDFDWSNTFPVKGALGLIDEYFFVLNPRIAGRGPRLEWTPANLKFAGAKRFRSGALALRYERP